MYLGSSDGAQKNTSFEFKLTERHHRHRLSRESSKNPKLHIKNLFFSLFSQTLRGMRLYAAKKSANWFCVS